MSKQYAKAVYLGVGVHNMGTATSIAATKDGNVTIEVQSLGVVLLSKKIARKVFIPFANIRALELDFNKDFNLDNKEELKPQLSMVKK